MTMIKKKYEAPIRTGVAAASAIGPAGIIFPGFDMAGIGVVWTTMLGAIANKSDHAVDGAAIAKIAAAGVRAASGYALGSKVLSWSVMLLVPVGGIPAAMAANAALNGLFTLKLGATTAKQFDRPNFNGLDAVKLAGSIVHAIHPIPTGEELALLKSMLARA